MRYAIAIFAAVLAGPFGLLWAFVAACAVLAVWQRGSKHDANANPSAVD